MAKIIAAFLAPFTLVTAAFTGPGRFSIDRAIWSWTERGAGWINRPVAAANPSLLIQRSGLMRATTKLREYGLTKPRAFNFSITLATFVRPCWPSLCVASFGESPHVSPYFQPYFDSYNSTE
ncbi:MAG: hypothetical protein ABI183_23965 [Polyangiaceae bacterium]